MSIFEGFSKGIMQAVGFRMGMAYYENREERVILRNRRITNIFYFFSNIYIIYLALSLDFVGIDRHIFSKFIDYLGLFDENNLIYAKGSFTTCAATLSLFVNIFAYTKNTTSGRSFLNLGRPLFLIVQISYSILAFALTYDVAYYFWGNRYLTPINYVCINFANYATWFATSAAIVCFVRSLFGVLPNEEAVLVFFLTEVIRIKKSGLYIAPSFPIPHFLFILLTAMYDTCILMYGMYLIPDGREVAKQLNVKN